MMCSLNNEGRSVVGGFVQHAPPSRCETPPCVEYMCVCVCVFLFSFFPCLGSVACWVSLHLLFVRVPSQRWILPEPRWAEGGTEEGWLVILWDVGGRTDLVPNQRKK